MKRRKLIVTLEMMGCKLIRHGSNHDWYQNPRTRFFQPVPRHPDISERLAKQIIKKLQND
ncbi:MAG TPA: addiction module toxin, HicA family [Prolixibacteraceae bacterium]|nr:addiction module toxin, HicA family [Prolixibacteraceae bacterium]